MALVTFSGVAGVLLWLARRAQGAGGRHLDARVAAAYRLRMARYCSIALVGALATACQAHNASSASSQKQTAEEMEGITQHQEGDLTVKTYDLFHTGRPDVWEYYKTIPDPAGGKPTLQLVRKEMDLNDDGKVDLWRWYNDKQQVVKEALDLDFDGHVDELILFDDKGVPVKKELALNFTGKPNLWKYYEKGNLVRKERDTKGTGKVDTWEYWEGGHIDRVGTDTDGDGVVDQWTKRNGG
jgi:hypothetical protein